MNGRKITRLLEQCKESTVKEKGVFDTTTSSQTSQSPPGVLQGGCGISGDLSWERQGKDYRDEVVKHIKFLAEHQVFRSTETPEIS